MKVKIHLVIFLLSLILLGCRTHAPESAHSPSAAVQNLTVSAAVSLKNAFNELGGLYQSQTGKKVEFNYGASGVLQKQIETGAPVDVFASAGASQMNALAAQNLIDAATRRDFARNTLVLIVPSEAKLTVTAFADLARADVRKIAVGNPKTVPAGQYTQQVFEKNGLQNSLSAKLILAEDVRQVLDYVVRGETDAGIVYASDAQSAGARVRVAATAPEDSHEPILYPLAVVRDSRQKEAAQAFINLVTSAAGQSILRKYGFQGTTEK